MMTRSFCEELIKLSTEMPTDEGYGDSTLGERLGDYARVAVPAVGGAAASHAMMTGVRHLLKKYRPAGGYGRFASSMPIRVGAPAIGAIVGGALGAQGLRERRRKLESFEQERQAQRELQANAPNPEVVAQ